MVWNVLGLAPNRALLFAEAARFVEILGLGGGHIGMQEPILHPVYGRIFACR